MENKIVAFLFMLAFFPLSAQKNQNTLGLWSKVEKKNNKTISTFTIHLDYIKNDTILGSYCAVAREGRKIDCSPDKNDMNLKIVKKNNYYEVFFYSFFDALNGKAKIIFSKGNLIWNVTKSPNGEYYAPHYTVMKKK